MNKFNITIDGKKCSASSDETILTVARRNNIDIPTLCYLEETEPFTSCFICAVEVKGRERLLPACSTLVTPDLEVTTNSQRVIDTRKMCLELLLSDHCGDCIAPCQASCPAGLDIPGFIHLLLDDKPYEAVRLIKDTIPLPASLGRVCPRPCEDSCRRASLESPVSICYLKRYVADEDLKTDKSYIPKIAAKTGKKVAVIGGGPAGLSAAFYLAKSGHDVTIFDAHPKSGGMLRYGIPAYRLPRNILDDEIKVIEKMGVSFKQGEIYGKDFDLKSLKASGFEAIFLAVGAQMATDLGIQGEEDGGALAGIAFLDDVSNGADVQIGDNVVVVGGGNTAIDAARTSVRLGAKEVIVLYRRTRNEMPANEIEIVEAEREGVKFQYLAAPVAMERTDVGIDLLCRKMELGQPDASGRRRPVPVKGSEYTIHCSTVISAIGQKVDVTNYEMKNFNLTRWNTIDVDPNTFETNVDGIFAGGDCVSGADIAVRAVATGKKAAMKINEYFTTKHLSAEFEEFDSKMGEFEEIPSEVFKGIEPIERAKMPELKTEERKSGFQEVELGFDYETALKEAKRCLACGCASAEDCKTRKLATDYQIDPERFKGAKKKYYIDDSHPQILFESHKCILCCNCIRYLKEVKNIDSLGLINRGFETMVRAPLGKTLAESYPSDDVEWVKDICPSGALSLKGRFEKYK